MGPSLRRLPSQISSLGCREFGRFQPKVLFNKNELQRNADFLFKRDPETLVTASDDFTLKIWRSRNRARQLNFPVSDAPQAIDFRRRDSSRRR